MGVMLWVVVVVVKVVVTREDLQFVDGKIIKIDSSLSLGTIIVIDVDNNDNGHHHHHRHEDVAAAEGKPNNDDNDEQTLSPFPT